MLSTPRLAVCFALLHALSGSLRAQAPDLSVTADAASGQRGVLTLQNVLADSELQQAVRSGLPLRLRFRVELWRDAMFDELTGSEQWTAVLTFDPLAELYLVRTRGSATTAHYYANYDGARAQVESAYATTLRPTRQGRYYYTASVDIETLSLSDLDELERWLKGELQPAVSGERSIPGALGQGARRLLMRVLSLPERRLEARSTRFRVP